MPVQLHSHKILGRKLNKFGKKKKKKWTANGGSEGTPPNPLSRKPSLPWGSRFSHVWRKWKPVGSCCPRQDMAHWTNIYINIKSLGLLEKELRIPAHPTALWMQCRLKGEGRLPLHCFCTQWGWSQKGKDGKSLETERNSIHNYFSLDRYHAFNESTKP